MLPKKEEYINKAETFLKEEIKYDYTNKYQAKIKKSTKEIYFMAFMEVNKKKMFVECNPIAPKSKYQIKLHKEGIPVRPIYCILTVTNV